MYHRPWQKKTQHVLFLPVLLSDSRSSTPTQNGDECRSKPSAASGDSHEAQVAQRSGWQAVLLEAGGLSAALSEDVSDTLIWITQHLREVQKQSQ